MQEITSLDIREMVSQGTVILASALIVFNDLAEIMAERPELYNEQLMEGIRLLRKGLQTIHDAKI